jgi:hypothetical protein
MAFVEGRDEMAGIGIVVPKREILTSRKWFMRYCGGE